jgi:hypothetical protein
MQAEVDVMARHIEEGIAVFSAHGARMETAASQTFRPN